MGLAFNFVKGFAFEAVTVGVKPAIRSTSFNCDRVRGVRFKRIGREGVIRLQLEI